MNRILLPLVSEPAQCQRKTMKQQRALTGCRILVDGGRKGCMIARGAKDSADEQVSQAG